MKGGEGLIKKKKQKNSSNKYFPKTVYWRPLVPNAESVDKTVGECRKMQGKL